MTPSRSTMIRSAICATTARSCETWMAVLPRSLIAFFDDSEHLNLRRDVERRTRLVEDDELRIINERHCGEQALQLTARDLVRLGRHQYARDWATRAHGIARAPSLRPQQSALPEICELSITCFKSKCAGLHEEAALCGIGDVATAKR